MCFGEEKQNFILSGFMTILLSSSCQNMTTVVMRSQPCLQISETVVPLEPEQQP